MVSGPRIAEPLGLHAPQIANGVSFQTRASFAVGPMSFDEAHWAVSPFPGRVPRPRASDAESQCGGLHRSKWRGAATEDREPRRGWFRIVRGGTRRRRIRRGPNDMTPKEIRSRRLALGMSVEQLAHEVGVAADHVREMESGEPPIDHAHLLSRRRSRGGNANSALDCGAPLTLAYPRCTMKCVCRAATIPAIAEKRATQGAAVLDVLDVWRARHAGAPAYS